MPSHHHGHAVGGVGDGDGDGFCLLAFGGYENGGKKSGTKMAGRKSCTTPTSARPLEPAGMVIAVAAPANNI